MDIQTCLKCCKSLDVNGCIVCELCNKTVNIVELCPKLTYQFSNQYDFMDVFN